MDSKMSGDPTKATSGFRGTYSLKYSVVELWIIVYSNQEYAKRPKVQPYIHS